MKALEKCANGCDAPPARPSKVLCAECLKKLGEKMQRLADNIQPTKPKECTDPKETSGHNPNQTETK